VTFQKRHWKTSFSPLSRFKNRWLVKEISFRDDTENKQRHFSEMSLSEKTLTDTFQRRYWKTPFRIDIEGHLSEMILKTLKDTFQRCYLSEKTLKDTFERRHWKTPFRNEKLPPLAAKKGFLNMYVMYTWHTYIRNTYSLLHSECHVILKGFFFAAKKDFFHMYVMYKWHRYIWNTYSLLHLECHVILISNLNRIGLFSTERGKRDLEN